jgi:hypothetical protein
VIGDLHSCSFLFFLFSGSPEKPQNIYKDGFGVKGKRTESYPAAVGAVVDLSCSFGKSSSFIGV